jgi:phytoene dehydrogenase-like protein
VAHPLDDGTAVIVERSIEATAAGLGPDAKGYRRLMGRLVEGWDTLAADLLAPLQVPRHPVAMARFGMKAIRSVRGLAESRFEGERARALLAGLGGHAIMPLERMTGAAIALVLGASAHAVGWPMPRGGSRKIAEALAATLTALGGEIRTGSVVESLDALPPARVILCDVTPRQLLKIAGDRLRGRYRRQLERYRYGPAAFKLDFALWAPIPWKAKECARAGTVHLGGTLEEIAGSEAAVDRGEPPERPYVLLAQQSLFDPTRAPHEKHTAWAYCHVPNGSTFDMRARIEAQIERFAPGFRDVVLARNVMTPARLQEHNANYVGGDISGGAQDLRQLFTRPALRIVPYSTPVPGLYICSSSTPPGGGVHGMCGHHAARAALRAMF